MDVKKQINTALDSGKVVIGSKKTIDALLYGEPKLILLAGNCPRKEKESIKYYSRLANIRCVTLKESSIELGSVCGKPHPISAMAVIHEGDSTILEVRE